MRGLVSLWLFAAMVFARPVAAGPVAPPPRLGAQAWMLVDYATGNILAQRNANRALPPASLTKLMTAYLVFERLRAGTLSLDEEVVISREAARTRGSRVRLKPGSRVRVEDLIKSMLLRSANDATVALVEHIAGGEALFVVEMNARAGAWGLEETRFVNSHGLDAPGHMSSARDLSRIAAALIRDFPDYYDWFSLRDFTFRDVTVRNSNALLWYDPSVDGMKTGFTARAGWCLIASARREDMRLIATVLGARNRTARINAAHRLLEYGFRNFETRLVHPASQPAAEARVLLGDSARVPLGVADDLYVTLPQGTFERLRKQVRLAEVPHAPVRFGQRLGSLVLSLDDKVFGRYPLVALREVRGGSLAERGLDRLQLWLY